MATTIVAATHGLMAAIIADVVTTVMTVITTDVAAKTLAKMFVKQHVKQFAMLRMTMQIRDVDVAEEAFRSLPTLC